MTNKKNIDLHLTDEQMELMKEEIRPSHINSLMDEIHAHECIEIEIDPALDLVIQD